MDTIGIIVLATGALGSAAFGIVEGLKVWKVLGEAGFATIWRVLGPIVKTLTVAYGTDAERIMRGHYRGESRELARVIRQGVRTGLPTRRAMSCRLSSFSGRIRSISRLATTVQETAATTRSRRASIRNRYQTIEKRITGTMCRRTRRRRTSFQPRSLPMTCFRV